MTSSSLIVAEPATDGLNTIGRWFPHANQIFTSNEGGYFLSAGFCQTHCSPGLGLSTEAHSEDVNVCIIAVWAYHG
jgi:hypothetical protein